MLVMRVKLLAPWAFTIIAAVFALAVLQGVDVTEYSCVTGPFTVECTFKLTAYFFDSGIVGERMQNPPQPTRRWPCTDIAFHPIGRYDMSIPREEVDQGNAL